MMPSRIVQRLIWKSARQAVPLVVLLLLLVGIAATWNVSLSKLPNWATWNVLFGMIPILFSVGAGSTLVSMDRDSRAMDWGKTLPVPWYAIAITPVATAAAILAVLWSTALTFMGLTSEPIRGFASDVLRMNPTYFVAHSFYLLLCGFAAAWMLRAPLAGLLAIIPLASIPAIIEYSRQAIERWTTDKPDVRYLPDLNMPQALAVLSICSLCMLGLMSFYSRRALSPTIHRVKKTGAASRVVIESLALIAETKAFESYREPRPMYRVSTLIWGFYRENVVVFRAAQASSILLAWALWVQHATSWNSIWQTPATVTAVLSGAILAVIPTFTFLADSIGDRIRYLTERGVRPAELWWSRQLVTLGVVSFFLFMLFVISQFGWYPAQIDWVTLFVLLFNAYAISQWIGQVIPRLMVGILASLGAVWISSALIIALNHERWIAVVGDIVLFFATYWMTQPWMERRIGWKYWLKQLSFITPLLVLFMFIFPGQVVGYSNPNVQAAPGISIDWILSRQFGMVVLFNAYAISQWLIQKINRVVFATGASMLVVMLASNLMLVLGRYFWLVLVVDLALLFDTYGARQRHRVSVGFAKTVFGYAILLPTVMYCTVAAVTPELSPISKFREWTITRARSGDIDRWLSEAESLTLILEPEREIHVDWPEVLTIELTEIQKTLPHNDPPSGETDLDRSNRLWVFLRKHLADALESQIKPGEPISTNLPLDEFLGHASRVRLDAIQTNEPQSVEAYLRWVKLTIALTTGLRRSRELSSQVFADQTEIWLMRQCLMEDSKTMIDSQTREAICALVEDKQRRWKARRNAVLLAGWRLRYPYHAKNSAAASNIPYLPNGISQEQVVFALLQDTDNVRFGENDFPMMSVRKLYGLPPTNRERSEYLDWYLANDVRTFSFSGMQTAFVWGGGWETQAENFRELTSGNAKVLSEAER